MTERTPDTREWDVVVVFDIEAPSREDAYRAFCEVMDWKREHSEPTVGSLIMDAFHRAGTQSWWFPESEFKHIDGNDNDGMRLVPEDER